MALQSSGSKHSESVCLGKHFEHLGFLVRGDGVQILPPSLLAVGSWVSLLMSLSFSFIISKMRIIILCRLRGLNQKMYPRQSAHIACTFIHNYYFYSGD